LNSKKILIISPTPTHPPYAGNRNAILSYTELLKKMNHDLSFLYIDVTKNVKDFNETENYWGNKFYYLRPNELYHKKLFFFKNVFKKFRNYYNVDNWYPNELNRYVKNLLGKKKFDAVIVNYIWYSKVFNLFKHTRKILFTHDVFSNRFQRTGIMWFSVPKAQEKKALNRADVILAIQKEESEFFKSLTKKKVITTYSSIEIIPTKICSNKNILFFAGSNEHNVEGIIEFIKIILPSLKNKFPELNLIIGGRICARDEVRIYKDDVTLYGEVENTIDFYSLGDIVVNPVSKGTGLKIKNIEALSFEKIVICHPHNLVGFFRMEEVPIYKASTSEEYITVLSQLFLSDNEIKKTKTAINQYMNNYKSFVTKKFSESLETE
jgi:hypothetical protein